MSYNSPISREAQRPDIGLDTQLKILRDRFGCLSWLGPYIFLRAYTNTMANQSGQTETVPIVYMGDGEYYDARPNDNLPCTLFFRAIGDEYTNFDRSKMPGQRSILSERPVSLVFWGDLTRINPEYKGDYVYTESIKEEFIKILQGIPAVKSLDRIVDDPIEDVFFGYTLAVNILDRKPGSTSYNRNPRNDRNQNGKFPYAGLRIDFTLAYRLSC